MNRAVTTSSYWLKDGVSKYGEEVIYKSLPMSIVKSDVQPQPAGGVRIKGWASTTDIDLENDRIEPTAFASSLSEYLRRGLMMFMHDWYSIPIGKFDVGEIKDTGFWVEGMVLPTSQGKDVALLIENSVLDALSVGFAVKRATIDETTKVRTIHDLHLYEISVVNAGMNPFALFTHAKGLKLEIPAIDISQDTDNHYKRKFSTMDPNSLEIIKKCEDAVKGFGDSFSKVTTDVEDLRNLIKKQNELLALVQDKQKNLSDGLMTMQEFKTFSEKIGADILTINAEIEKVKAARSVVDKRISITDWRSRMKNLIVVRDDHGRPLGPNQQKAWHYFQAPVDYSTDEGRLLKTLRDLNDAVVITDAVLRKSGRRYDISTLKSYRLLHEMVGVLDPEFAKAMYSTGTALGDEWVPTELSQEIMDLYRLEATLESYIDSFDMQTNPATLPHIASSATMYLAGEPATNNPDTILKSSVGTGLATFTAGCFAIAVPYAVIFEEDAILGSINAIRSELAYAGADGYASVLVNGDNTATHFDNATVTLYATTAPEVYEKGFRRIASDLSKTFDAASVTAGVGDATAAFAAEDWRYMRKLMHKMGVKPNEVVNVTSVGGYYKTLSMAQYSQPGTYIAGDTWRVGALTAIDGSPLVVSAAVPENLNASGIYDGTTTTYTCAFAFNRRGFKIGRRRGITVEFEHNIQTQQNVFVSTMRKSFQKVTPSGLYPVALGYKITS